MFALFFSPSYFFELDILLRHFDLSIFDTFRAHYVLIVDIDIIIVGMTIFPSEATRTDKT